jgi:diguanylate cyclase (GGDEF)-like protein
MHRRLRFLADMDVLTRVPNRRHFHELAGRTRSAVPAGCALMMFDIDHFKRINDLLGHATGDEALRQVARCVRDSLRTQDVAGRLGGDEFAVLLPETTVHDAMAVASRIATRLDDRQVAPQLARLSLSFGVVQLHDGETVPEALRRADQALYEAKRQGRSRAVIAFGVEAQPVFSESRSLGLSTT